MKKALLAAAVLCIIGITTSCTPKDKITVDTSKAPELRTQADSLSWALGFSIAQNIANTGIETNQEVILQAIFTTLNQKQQPLTQQQTYQLLNELDRLAFIAQTKNHESQMKETQAREEAYFADLLSKNPNVKKSDKGYYYEVLQEGKGRKGDIGLVALFDYKGSYTNGQVFDQTYGNNDTVRHLIDESIMPGLLDGLCNMRAGSTYRFYFPSELAFGAKGTDGIPPYSTVIYEIALYAVTDL